MHTIDPNGVYTVELAAKATGLPAYCLSREIREGKLRVAKKARTYLVLGKWLIEWIESGELKSAATPRIADILEIEQPDPAA